jgi:hypothetical protein
VGTCTHMISYSADDEEAEYEEEQLPEEEE